MDMKAQKNATFAGEDSVIEQKGITKREESQMKWTDAVKDPKTIISFLLYMLTIIEFVYCVYVLPIDLYHLSAKHIVTNPLFVAFASLLPVATWVYSSQTEFWCFRRRKRAMFWLAIINFIVLMLHSVYKATWQSFVPLIYKIHVDEYLTITMNLNLGRIILIVFLLFFSYVVGSRIFESCGTDEISIFIDTFKITHYIDKRKHKEAKYDLSTVRSLDTGRILPVRENDRFTHILVDGGSGTGKTSSVLIRNICQDLNQSVFNYEMLERKALEFLNAKKGYIRQPFSDFKPEYIEPYEPYRKKWEEICNIYQSCGMTVVAPNSELTDDTVKLAKAKGITNINIVDPTLDEKTGKYKDNLKGLNPFYIPWNTLNEENRHIYATTNAMLFSSVLQSINEMNGKSDPYFSGLNNTVTQHVAIIVMIGTHILEHRSANYVDIQRVIDNFRLINTYVSAVENVYGQVKIEKVSPQERKISEQNPYYTSVAFAKTELLGEGAAKMFDQARGLRNLIDSFIAHPHIQYIFTRPDDQVLDFDKILANGEITVCNYAYSFGTQVSTAFGLYFLLQFKNASFRRPGTSRTRRPHFITIDEFPVLLHQDLEQCFTLWRQFRVSAAVAIQSLSQMDKTPMTKYFKNVLQTLGTHIVFGRAGTEEMRLYSILAGTDSVLMEQKTEAETSILSDNPTFSWSTRTTPQEKKVMEERDIRNRDFQEITFMTVKDNRVMDAESGKVSFLTDSDWEERRRQKINWSSLCQLYLPNNKYPDLDEFTPSSTHISEEGALIQYYEGGEFKKELAEAPVIKSSPANVSRIDSDEDDDDEEFSLSDLSHSDFQDVLMDDIPQQSGVENTTPPDETDIDDIFDDEIFNNYAQDKDTQDDYSYWDSEPFYEQKEEQRVSSSGIDVLLDE